ncbi:hypothetical protein A2572_04345 [Candidatus Collierbacteria bacterium RIFOXYD1_FULL_40_9]|uniref:Transglutaminase-like domain-containing protein n=1 Tax=Candidatus Collierbacteria bacterium RIFOXYD1_FULL_40_9 TaxID=1817731 RepID=A0A1F5FPK4_9BACT|nr:MAG: hypothetical protein A2572_04345 [Candidatus Collierbacteria bacterium RIFOXYD1_FULL_40_9]
MGKFINIIFIFFFCFFFSSLQNPIFAITKFDTKYQVYYKVEENGNTKVTFVINQKNNLSVVYATEYGISLNETRINNLKILDEGVSIANPNVVKSQNQTIISFPFANKVVGKNQTRNFTIEYETTDIVSKQGSTWQINIPRFESNESISEQTAILSLPENFPQPAYIDPKPDIVNNNTYYFSSKSMANKPISAIFGKAQYYKGKINYQLQNEQSTKLTKSITLIPNTSYQTVFYESISPMPDSVSEDQDGNLLAYYSLKPGQTINITANLNIQTNFQPNSPRSPISDQKYTENNQIWNYDHSAFTTPEIKSLNNPKAIYDYVTNKLKYDYQKINEAGTVRQPASDILSNYQSAICTDFTDLFVTLARKVGIPARELEGYAISDNQDLKPISSKIDLLHAWPEYFDKDKKLWIQVDPTWANTTKGLDYFSKLDFNHIVFAIHGLTPLEPIPAGGFKNANNKEKQIQIIPSKEVVFPNSTPVPTLTPDKINSAKLTFKNEQGVYFYGQAEVVENSYLKPLVQALIIPPYSKAEITIKTKPISFFDTNGSKSIIIINGQQHEIQTTTEQTTSPFFLAASGILLGTITLIARSLLLRKLKKRTSLHR